MRTPGRNVRLKKFFIPGYATNYKINAVTSVYITSLICVILDFNKKFMKKYSAGKILRVILSVGFLFVAGFAFIGCGEDEEPVNVEELLNETFLGFEDNGSLAITGDVQPFTSVYGTARAQFNKVFDKPGCFEEPSSYIRVDSLGPIWQDGFTVAAFVTFSEPRLFERIIDFGNGEGDQGGMNITLSRIGIRDDIGLTSWINSDSVLNRSEGRVVAFNVIQDGEPMFVVGSISPDGVMSLYINGVLEARKTNGHPVSNVSRNMNYIGRSNWCERDPDFKGSMDALYIFNRELSSREAEALYDYLLSQ